MDIYNKIIDTFVSNPSLLIVVGLLALFGLVAKAALFAKCEQPAWASLIPGYDIIIVLRIVGRPAVHFWLFLIPVFNIVFLGIVLIELAKSFGKYSILDHIFMLVFNVFYVMNLGLAPNEDYYGPSFNVPTEELKTRKTPLYA